MLDLKNGLSNLEVIERQKKYGKNILVEKKKSSFLLKLLHIIFEPMFFLLVVASLIYFFLGEPRDGLIMLLFVIVMISIDVFQEWKTDKTLESLKELSVPSIYVLRDGVKTEVSSEELVPGDIVYIHEGVFIPADGNILKCSGLKVDESTLTGESTLVYKTEEDKIEDNYYKNNFCYAGTFVVSGTGILQITKTGNHTEYGKIGKSILDVSEEKTPLQKQTDKIVKICALIALLLFLFVSLITFMRLPDYDLKDRLIQSILSGITLAMAMIPEEFPVVFTVFLSIGAFRLARKHALVKKLPAVETLGSISVLCVDKTGTITENKMHVESVVPIHCLKEEFVEAMGLSCEEDAFDPMEQAMISNCYQEHITKEHLFHSTKIKSYPFSDELKMMGNYWIHENEKVITVKGSYESILDICELTEEEKKQIEKQIETLSDRGERVIAVAKKSGLKDEIPEKLTDIRFQLCGFVGLVDPPRKNMKENIQLCKDAHVRVMMITGDNGRTAHAIAHQIGLEHQDEILTGKDIDNLNDEALKEKLKTVNLFSRVVPNHKLRIVKLLKEMGEVVAMTGDGVNDAPALKAASIGIAMGKKGTSVTREAADLILLDDNFETIVHTIENGRRIFDNMKKAFGYIFVIHIPIALSSLLGPVLGILPNELLLLPIHVVLLELFIDPTCSVVLERQPAEQDIMKRYPRKLEDAMLSLPFLLRNLLQGFILFLVSFGTYYYLLQVDTALTARSVGLFIIMLGNLFLVQVNSSQTMSAIKTMKLLKHDKVMWGIHLFTIFMIVLVFYSPITYFLKLEHFSFSQFFFALVVSMLSIYWFEIVKYIFRKKSVN